MRKSSAGEHHRAPRGNVIFAFAIPNESTAHRAIFDHQFSRRRFGKKRNFEIEGRFCQSCRQRVAAGHLKPDTFVCSSNRLARQQQRAFSRIFSYRPGNGGEKGTIRRFRSYLSITLGNRHLLQVAVP
jgi:hypothetical protein